MKKNLLEILETEARAPVEKIAKRLGVTEREVRKTLEELEKTNVILGYRAVINPEKIEDEIVSAIIEVNIVPQRDRGFDAVAKRIYQFPEVKSCFLVSGPYDLLVFVDGKTLKEVATFVAEKLATLDAVQKTATHFLLKKYKQDGIMLIDEEKGERLAVTP